jgi:DNA-binding HxlR family transcriptional regulator
MAERRYDQNCPIAMGLDVLGERWTLLILRELVGGVRRYSDLRAELPGIATNLLAQRLRQLEDNGLISRSELPPPAARTVYRLTDRAWQEIPPILRALALFGLGWLPAFGAADSIPPFTGFLAGILMGFDPAHALDVDATYQVTVDDRVFDFAVHDGHLAGATGEPQVRVTASARDLVALRLGEDPRSASSQITIEGSERAKERFCTAFGLPRRTARGRVRS